MFDLSFHEIMDFITPEVGTKTVGSSVVSKTKTCLIVILW